MTTHPILDLSLLDGDVTDRQFFLNSLDQACRYNGFFYLTQHGIPTALLDAVNAQSRHFFDLEAAQKDQIHLRHSTNFRGYSQMKNERDWREQVHFGQERPFVSTSEHPAECYRLAGGNLWPQSLGDTFRDTMLTFLEAAHQVGQKLLSAFAGLLHLPDDYFRQLSGEPPYLLMKLICYYAQPDSDVDRPGVAAHCDWSWLTILLQDDVGGLEVLSPDNQWHAAPPVTNALSVNLGELLEILTKGRYVATAHRVINPSEEKRRISVPVFINPALDARISPLDWPVETRTTVPAEHIHRVVAAGTSGSPFTFGASEWVRKGRGIWCYNNGCLHH